MSHETVALSKEKRAATGSGGVSNDWQATDAGSEFVQCWATGQANDHSELH